MGRGSGMQQCLSILVTRLSSAYIRACQSIILAPAYMRVSPDRVMKRMRPSMMHVGDDLIDNGPRHACDVKRPSTRRLTSLIKTQAFIRRRGYGRIRIPSSAIVLVFATHFVKSDRNRHSVNVGDMMPLCMFPLGLAVCAGCDRRVD